ncbi:hypothetical protein CICLE_v10017357mg [Citrus x clementina]|uniref:Uncharacterized protein n=1 Tax=Citrus clementina TaxID=85681 RepID=V4W477_CITCL|nr:hypothetical protein CICLE_v10017357mg [Citrus x clementina]
MSFMTFHELMHSLHCNERGTSFSLMKFWKLLVITTSSSCKDRLTKEYQSGFRGVGFSRHYDFYVLRCIFSNIMIISSVK